MSYPTLDYLPDLTSTQMAGARPLILTALPAPPAGIVWDNGVIVAGSNQFAILHSIYKFTAIEGATYDFFSTSYFDPFVTIVYDDKGNAVVANSELDDLEYGNDIIWDWVAPYSGTFYFNASWNQGDFFRNYSLGIYEDVNTSPFWRSVSYVGTAADETMYGGAGDDSLLGLDGADRIFGGDGRDDLNGNVGVDFVSGGPGADTVRGGRDNDTVLGDAGDDPHLNGNIGDDVVNGGAGSDTVFGGQGQDTLHGDEGADLLSGDLGFDHLYGDGGADRFVIRQGSQQDWAADFNPSEGDRIQLATGAAYSVSSISGRVVIDLGGGDMLGLSTQAQGSFSSDWIVFA